ncbi:F420-dependent oxidoreductase [Frankia sp. R43]|uniref:LLM class F420-dependent oxidoreductase n=1 Tax=Frankia sp. R43 TaxID=269536 RepID=UPI0006CA4177|nr:LLM class F420-dependent oxidoreductase [Frankia sp. R43]KPM53030.1 F420-dependent oxidoreductase [Frankia sp. R43]
MTMNVARIGLWMSARQWPHGTAERRDTAQELAELGYDMVWLGGATADLELPAALLESTERLCVGTGILNIWTESVDLLADTYGMLEKAHPGRLLLGVGAGHARMVESVTGRRYRRPLGAVISYLEALDAVGIPASARVLAALGPRMLGLAARRSAGAHPYLVTPEHTRMAREILGPGALLAPEQKIVLETDPARARAIGRAALSIYLELPNYTNNLRRLGFTDADLAAGGSDRLVDALIAWGDLDSIRTRLEEHCAAGADQVAVQILTDNKQLPRAQWRILAAGLDLRPPAVAGAVSGI